MFEVCQINLDKFTVYTTSQATRLRETKLEVVVSSKVIESYVRKYKF